MFRKIHIQNFKSLADVSTELSPFTVLVGSNGAGKSSFLQAIELMSWTVHHASISEALAAHNIDFRDLIYLRSRESSITLGADIEVPALQDAASDQIHVEMCLKKRRYVYLEYEFVEPVVNLHQAKLHEAYGVTASSRERLVWEGAEEIVHLNVPLGHSMLRDVFQTRRAEQRFPILYRVARHFMDYVHYEIWGPEQLREPSNGHRRLQASPQDGRALGKSGEGLPSLLWSIRLKSPERWAALLAELRLAYPMVREIHFKRGVEAAELGLIFREEGTASSASLTYRPAQMSDGFLRLLALLAIKYQPTPLALLGYEEPENGLHLSALHECMRHLKEIAKSGTQVIVTTHSPYLLNHLLEDETEPVAQLRLVLRGGDGKTRIVPPDPEKILLARRQGFGIGELWGSLLNEEELASK